MSKKIILPGGAGLVGQNLIAQLKSKVYATIVVLDKHRHNMNVLKQLHPDIIVEYANLAESGEWQKHFADADCVVMLQAQITSKNYQDYVRNNIDSTRLIINTIKTHKVPYLVHISSSVVASVADDFYSNSKKYQENMVLESDIPSIILRPTLMFGWFDRKHLGWLSRFMKKVPLFPIPGLGRYIRQPLYVGDFCNIIISCIMDHNYRGIYNISGHECIYYIDIIREIRRVTNTKSLILPIPYAFFRALLWLWARFDKNPPFTTQQLTALTAGDEFDIIDWPGIFDVPCTPFKLAVNETFNDSRYSNIVLDR